MKLTYLERKTGKILEEKVFGGKFIALLYARPSLATCIAKMPWISRFYGFWQRLPFTKRKVAPFIVKFDVDASEFASDQFASFHDFFIRKLKKEARPIAFTPVVAPADGRYLFFNQDTECQVKGQLLPLKGPALVARLAPQDYHRFHFPVDGIPTEAKCINGPLYSVNPIALKWNAQILLQNKRFETTIRTDFGDVLMYEVGATNVGSIVETFAPEKLVSKGDEKGFFEFGGSAIVIQFPKGIKFAPDLIAATEKGLEVRCEMGSALV